MKILIIGNGGREHALAWKFAQSPLTTRVFVAPGNGGTAREFGVENVPIAATEIAALVQFAREQVIDLTIIGPEAPLVAGIVDAFEAADLPCFGPRRAAAQLEGSKAFAKDFLARHQIPTAAYGVFTEIAPALAYLRAVGAPIVIKADGLAAGKGVILAEDLPTAEAAVCDMLNAGRFGVAGARVVIEEFLTGEEASFIVMVDGEQVLPLATSQDHKARDDGDCGPNTGGMGAYSPAPIVTPAIHNRIMREVITPTVAGLAAEGIHYRGFLYAGLMITADGTPKVLEFNCRLGDPETQPLLMRLRSDMVELCLAAVTGRLAKMSAEWDARAAVGIVLAAAGYPDTPKIGDVINGLDAVVAAPDLKVFHAGTQLVDDVVKTNGGRVLCVTALGERVAIAQQRASQALTAIHWNGAFYRHDIGHRAIARETTTR
ncbi:phosphoribosylamine--glycine ligase [Chromatium weissei]|nr:phosphoribosylamine--glycine ligase [Chromatium weissei]